MSCMYDENIPEGRDPKELLEAAIAGAELAVVEVYGQVVAMCRPQQAHERLGEVLSPGEPFAVFGSSGQITEESRDDLQGLPYRVSVHLS